MDTIQVWPKNDEFRAVLRHPTGGRMPTTDDPANWPNDTYTYRRIQDGDVLTSDPGNFGQG
jgi:hypothetical protein